MQVVRTRILSVPRRNVLCRFRLKYREVTRAYLCSFRDLFIDHGCSLWVLTSSMVIILRHLSYILLHPLYTYVEARSRNLCDKRCYLTHEELFVFSLAWITIHRCCARRLFLIKLYLSPNVFNKTKPSQTSASISFYDSNWIKWRLSSCEQ